jgi:hypothetical protein
VVPAAARRRDRRDRQPSVDSREDRAPRRRAVRGFAARARGRRRVGGSRLSRRCGSDPRRADRHAWRAEVAPEWRLQHERAKRDRAELERLERQRNRCHPSRRSCARS